MLRNAGGEDDNIAVASIGEGAGANFEIAGSKREAVGEVDGFAFGIGAVFVDEDKFIDGSALI